MEGSSGTIADFCVGPDTARLAGRVKMMLEALKQHLTDFNFKDVRDGVVELRQLGRIMTGSDALGCESVPAVFAELNNLRVSRFEMAGVARRLR